jgi:hypothetical protein
MAENPRSKMNPYDAIYVCVSSYAELFLSCEYMRLATVKATLRVLKVWICQLLTVL